MDLKASCSPIIGFASHGDDITPPQQAPDRITETHSDVQEFRFRGQRIIYMMHDQIGPLGIVPSGSSAWREHSGLTSTLATIEALAPGLHEMGIEDIGGEGAGRRFTLGFADRRLEHIRALDDMVGDEIVGDERPFAAVARASAVQAPICSAPVRPAVTAT